MRNAIRPQSPLDHHNSALLKLLHVNADSNRCNKNVENNSAFKIVTPKMKIEGNSNFKRIGLEVTGYEFFFFVRNAFDTGVLNTPQFEVFIIIILKRAGHYFIRMKKMNAYKICFRRKSIFLNFELVRLMLFTIFCSSICLLVYII